MGLSLLSSISSPRAARLRELRTVVGGQRVAVDAAWWAMKAIAALFPMVDEELDEMQVMGALAAFFTYTEALMMSNAHVVLVFDGDSPDGKAPARARRDAALVKSIERKWRERRTHGAFDDAAAIEAWQLTIEAAVARHQKHLAALYGKVAAFATYMVRTHRDLDVVLAPREADPVMAHMDHTKRVQWIVSLDGDMRALEVRSLLGNIVLATGQCDVLCEPAAFDLLRSAPFETPLSKDSLPDWTHDHLLPHPGMLRVWGALSSCNFAESLPGIGAVNAARVLQRAVMIAAEEQDSHVFDVRDDGGLFYTCAKTQLGCKLKCWGPGGLGQLGYGDGSTRGDGAGEMGGALPFVSLGMAQVVTARSGDAHTCVLLDDSAIKCFGRNDDGALGYGDQENRGDNPGEMGTALQRVNVGPGTIVTPTAAPSMVLSSMPTPAPTSVPTAAPTTMPSSAPTTAPTTMPSSAPTTVPTQNPSSAPMRSPTVTPSVPPAPSSTPPMAPSMSPTDRGLPTDDDGADDDDGDSGGFLGLSDRQVIGIAVVGGVGLVLIIGIAFFFKQRAGRGGRSGGVGGGGGGGKNVAATNHVAKTHHVVTTNHAAAPTHYV